MPEPRALRITRTTRLVLRALLDNPDEQLWGVRIMNLTKLDSGTVYLILERLRDCGWVEAYWETDHPEDRPSRRYFRLTTWGTLRALRALGPVATLDQSRSWRIYRQLMTLTGVLTTTAVLATLIDWTTSAGAVHLIAEALTGPAWAALVAVRVARWVMDEHCNREFWKGYRP